MYSFVSISLTPSNSSMMVEIVRYLGVGGCLVLLRMCLRDGSPSLLDLREKRRLVIEKIVDIFKRISYNSLYQLNFLNQHIH